MTTDPAVLLAARLDVAEKIALAASPDRRREWRADIQQGDRGPAGCYVTAWPGEMPVVAALSLGAMGEAAVTHIALRDPASTLADIAADRELLAMYERARHRREGSTEVLVMARVIEVRAGAWGTAPE
jgi:hypothetical protein